MEEHADTSLVITSCRRHDLLKQTISSMQPWIGKFSHRIVIEDSDHRPRYFDELEADGFTVLINGSTWGQHRSIDLAYSQVDTEFIFHCEDDWKFLAEPNFHAAKHILTNGIEGHTLFSVVTFRDSARKEKRDQDTYVDYKLMGSHYRYSFNQQSKYNSFTFNPSLLRRSLHEITGPYADFLTEGSVARYLRKRGYAVVTQVPGVVRHLGEERHVQRKQHGWRARMSQWLRKGI